MIVRLIASIGELDDLWPKLTTAIGGRGIGQRSHKSRPPATLSVVSLVMEVSGAASETVQELTGIVHRDPIRNLRDIATALEREPDPDVIDWWADAVADWVRRARLLLGLGPVLPHQAYGATCPFCGASVATVREAGESWRVPAIGMTWVEQEFDLWEVRSIFCRHCGAEWLRGDGLGQMAELLLLMKHSQLIGLS